MKRNMEHQMKHKREQLHEKRKMEDQMQCKRAQQIERKMNNTWNAKERKTARTQRKRKKWHKMGMRTEQKREILNRVTPKGTNESTH